MILLFSGLYTVSIDADQQKVTVSGSVDSSTLIKKLTRAGMYAQLWSQKPNQNHKPNGNKVDQNAKKQKDGGAKGLKGFNNQQKLTPFGDFEDGEDCDIEDDDEFRLLEKKVNRLGLLRQANDVANAKKGGQANQNQNKGGNGKKVGGGAPGHNGDGKIPNAAAKNTNVIPNMKMNGAGIGNAEGKRMNDLITMNLNGYHGQPSGMMTGLGSNMGTFPYHQPTNFHNPGLPTNAANGYGVGLHHPSSMMMNLQNYQYHHPSMAMNLQSGLPFLQPQMTYNKSPLVSPYTGYYQVNPYPSSRFENSDYAAYMHSDETTSSCVVM